MPQHPLYERRPTRTVSIGQVGVGGKNPIRIQSMCISATTDTVSIIREMQTLVNAGCEIIRLTVPTQKDCDNLADIRKAMRQAHIKTPLVADIHFTPSIAMKCVDYVEKIRINPGNFVDKKLFKTLEYSDNDYASELLRIEEKFVPLVEKCKAAGIAMRIGTNHGSLSDRIMNRYGDTPQGMVESALEFLRIAIKLNYHDIIFSMKASNTQVMVTAYRELARQLDLNGFDYPFHLGVTEAGVGEDGRIKSAIGIGTLLEEGIGDTIRVSLTEDSEHEIPVATMLATPYNARMAREYWLKELGTYDRNSGSVRQPFSLSYARRVSDKTMIGGISHGGNEAVRVWTSFHENQWEALKECLAGEPAFEGVEFDWDLRTEGGRKPLDIGSIVTELKNLGKAASLRSSSLLGLIAGDVFDKRVLVVRSFDVIAHARELRERHILTAETMKGIWGISFDTQYIRIGAADFATQLKTVHDLWLELGATGIQFSVASRNLFQDARLLANTLYNNRMTNNIQLRYITGPYPAQLDAAIQIGGLLLDGIGDAIQIDDPESSPKESLALSYNILQGARIRISKTEYISCPSCGRTLFNIQETTEKIRKVTSHLKGVKIAVMGCVVNGPGEMADADFGYVGTGTSRISLYVGKDCVERNIPEESAVDKLIQLIKTNNRWIDRME